MSDLTITINGVRYHKSVISYYTHEDGVALKTRRTLCIQVETTSTKLVIDEDNKDRYYYISRAPDNNALFPDLFLCNAIDTKSGYM